MSSADGPPVSELSLTYVTVPSAATSVVFPELQSQLRFLSCPNELEKNEFLYLLDCQAENASMGGKSKSKSKSRSKAKVVVQILARL